MGTCSSLKNNSDFKRIGDNAKEGKIDALIDLNNNVLISKHKSNPEDDYKKTKFLGKGTFAVVFEVKNKLTGIIRAMKNFQKANPKFTEKQILNEISILTQMDHPNVLKIFSFYINNQNYSIITELCSGGQLYEEINYKGPFNEKKSSYILYQILSALNYCHKMNIIHRDIKPENILIMERDNEDQDLLYVKIADFGTAKIFKENQNENLLVGSPYYIAPEVLDKNYNEKCDLWSCGVLLYIFLTSKPPFNGNNNKEIFEATKKGVYDIKTSPWNLISKNAKDLITKLLEYDVNKRISAEEALKHNWFKENKCKEKFNNIENKVITEKLINNLINYKSVSVIQETALAYLVHNFNQTKSVINACKLFSIIDVNGDGKINEKDLYNGLKNIIKRKYLENDCKQIFNNIDMNHSGFIEYEEFVRAAVDKKEFFTEKFLRFAFNYFDKDHNNSIDYNEIEMVFKDNIVDRKNIHEGLQKIITEVDINKDGKITFDEFSFVMKKMLT